MGKRGLIGTIVAMGAIRDCSRGGLAGEEDFVDGLLEGFFGQEAAGDLGQAVDRDKDQHGDRRCLEIVGEFLFPVDIDFVEDNLIAVVLRKFGHNGRESAARSAPVGIEVDDAGCFAEVMPDGVGGIVEDTELEVSSREVTDVGEFESTLGTQRGWREK